MSCPDAMSRSIPATNPVTEALISPENIAIAHPSGKSISPFELPAAPDVAAA